MTPVHKFGGASLKDAASVRNMVRILKEISTPTPVVVVSAMGKSTNALENLHRLALRGDNYLHAFEGLRNFHFGIMEELFAEKHSVFKNLEKDFQSLQTILNNCKGCEFDYTYDQVVSFGEVFSSKIVAEAIREEGLSVQWLDACELITAKPPYRNGQLIKQQSCEQIQKIIPELLQKGVVPITQGFIASTPEGQSITLGREGSDYTGAIIASCLQAAHLTIWKDVDGLRTADPALFEQTSKLHHISYREAVELAFYGAKVIHPKTIKPLKNQGIPLFIRSFENPGLPPSIVNQDNDFRKTSSWILKTDRLLLSLSSKDYSFMDAGRLSQLLNILHEKLLSIDLIQNSAISFSVCLPEKETNMPDLVNMLKQEYHIRYNTGLSLLTVRHYHDELIQKLLAGKQILLQQISRHTAQFVFKTPQ